MSVGSFTDVATANVQYTLGRDDARSALAQVLEQSPDLVGLQEWYPPRYRLLSETGRLGLAGPVEGRLPGLSGPRLGYRWSVPLLGDCVVGARADRFELTGSRSVLLSGIGRAERDDVWLNLEPPRLATYAVYRDRHHDRTVSLVSYHLAPGVQSRDRYRPDRPVLTARHQREVRTLEQLVERLLGRGHDVYAVGDSNFHGLRLPGLTSAWDGRETAPGTLGPRRRVDDVHGPGPAESVQMIATSSDHRALVVRRRDLPPATRG